MLNSSSGMRARVVLCLVVSAGVILSVVTRGTQANSAIAPAHCNPNMMNSLPPWLRRTCNAHIETAEISSVLENYADEKSGQNGYLAEGNRRIKLQDVDHIFFRFGRHQAKSLSLQK